jgi:hypothetical protein
MKDLQMFEIVVGRIPNTRSIGCMYVLMKAVATRYVGRIVCYIPMSGRKGYACAGLTC